MRKQEKTMGFQVKSPANSQKWSEKSLAFCERISYNIDKGQERSKKRKRPKEVFT